MYLFKSLQEPFPRESGIRNLIYVAAFFGVFIFVFLFLFKPFELEQFSAGRLLLITGAYGLITFACIFLSSVFMPLVFPHYFREPGWTTGKQILNMLIVIFLVGLFNFLVSPFLVQTTYTIYDAIWFQGITLSVAMLPVSIFILVKQNRLLKKFREQAGKIETQLQEKIKQEESQSQQAQENGPQKIMLSGDYQQDKLELFPHQLYMVTSASNYVKLYHRKIEKLEYSIIRSTMKKTEEVLLPYPNFFKCHRAYIINLDKVAHVDGNAQGYKIKIEGYDELIPVSRNLNSEFSDKLLSIRNK